MPTLVIDDSTDEGDKNDGAGYTLSLTDTRITQKWDMEVEYFGLLFFYEGEQISAEGALGNRMKR